MLDVAVFPMVLKQRTISGSAVGGRRSFREMLRIVDLHNVRPMCEIMPLADANKAFDKLANGSPHYRCASSSTAMDSPAVPGSTEDKSTYNCY